MAKLPVIKRVLREDIPSAPDWIGRLLYPMNLFFENVYNALNSDLTFSENIRSQVKDISFTTSSAYDGTAANFETLEFTIELGSFPQGVFILSLVEDTDNFTPIEDSPFINWQAINGVMQISLITGLTASKSYILKVLVI